MNYFHFLFIFELLGTFQFKAENFSTNVKQNISAGRLDINIAEGIIKGTAGADFSSAKEDVAMQTFCTFHGDGTLTDVPITTEDAFKAYRNLSQQAKGSRAIVEFTLTPISEYCGSLQTKVMNSLPQDTLERLSEIALELDQTVRDTQELYKTQSSKFYAQELGRQVDAFLRILKKFQSEWKHKLAYTLP